MNKRNEVLPITNRNLQTNNFSSQTYLIYKDIDYSIDTVNQILKVLLDMYRSCKLSTLSSQTCSFTTQLLFNSLFSVIHAQ